jgi:hypothetical protein
MIDRRTFLKWLGLAPAVAAAPKVLTSTLPKSRLMGQRLQGILPDSLRIHADHFKLLEYLNDTQDGQLGLKDIAPLKG